MQTSIGGLLGLGTGLAMVFGIPVLWCMFTGMLLPAQVDVTSVFLSLGVAVGVGWCSAGTRLVAPPVSTRLKRSDTTEPPDVLLSLPRGLS